MHKTKETFVFGFALFAGFFGAGNLVLPPLLGFNSGTDWWLVAFGFIISATLIPMLALFGHAKLQGTMYDFGKKVSPLFSLIFCFSIYVLVITLPCPRTAAVAHEMAIAPFFNTSSLLTSVLFFGLVCVFVIKRDTVLRILGKYLMPIIVLIILAVIVIGLLTPIDRINPSSFDYPIISGLLEGYQTYDAIAGLVMGGMVLVSINKAKYTLSFEEKKAMIAKSGLIAVTGLFIIYAGLIAVGAHFNAQFNSAITRPELLAGLAAKTLGSTGAIFLSILVGLACFTTAVAIVISVADFFKAYFKTYPKAYLLTTMVCCVVGIFAGQMDVTYIIDVARPALMFIYPICIVLILLNCLPDKYATKIVFRAVIIVAFIFSIPDFLGFLMTSEKLNFIIEAIPFAKQNLGWVIPALFTFVLANVFQKKTWH